MARQSAISHFSLTKSIYARGEPQQPIAPSARKARKEIV
jgi:hypothetical protein